LGANAADVGGANRPGSILSDSTELCTVIEVARNAPELSGASIDLLPARGKLVSVSQLAETTKTSSSP
jgi:hypothetical protein